MRTTYQSYRYTGLNKLGIVGIVGTLVLYALIVYIPYCSYIFETKSVPSILVGFQGAPLSMLLLIATELHKMVTLRIDK